MAVGSAIYGGRTDKTIVLGGTLPLKTHPVTSLVRW